MDSLKAYSAKVDCRRRTVSLMFVDESCVIFKGREVKPSQRLFSLCNSSKEDYSDELGYLCYILGESEGEKKDLKSILIVLEYTNVFPEDLCGLPPKRVVDFHIDLMSRVKPIFKVPYRMAPAEMAELKKQLDELLEKGYIRPSVSPWGAPVLFVKKNDGSMRLCIETEN